jgi:S-adenosylmethionine:tRNA ribosyltransferase-isomerase
MDLSEYNYLLPPELIAQTPASPRDSSRLLVINKNTGQISHHIFRDLPRLLNPTDVLVFNNTKVFPARLHGTKSTGGKVEILLLKEQEIGLWEVISHPGIKPGQTLTFIPELTAEVITPNSLKFSILHSTLSISDLIFQIGSTPLPPYIHSHSSEELLRQQYQTVYANPAAAGSAAAPTAGLHFTKKLITNLPQQKEYLTLHVGLGTFKSPTPDQIASGHLHSEYYELNQVTARHLNHAKSEGRRVIAVGTTTARVLETTNLLPQSGNTNLFITQGYKFKVVDGLITNFHLPGTSLLMLVSALSSWPIIKHAYVEAIRLKYRFYSFGDACLII